jgi:hypothetical protein
LNIQSGALSLTGGNDLTNGTLNFGITNTSSFGTLNLSGHAALTGALGVTLYGYTLQIGDSFGLITYGSETGAFTAFQLPSTANWQETYGSTLFSLAVAPSVAPASLYLEGAFTVNGFNLQIFGPVGSNYTVQVSTNLAQTNWATLTNFVSTNGWFSVTDSAATNFDPDRFYRAVIH